MSYSHCDLQFKTEKRTQLWWQVDHFGAIEGELGQYSSWLQFYATPPSSIPSYQNTTTHLMIYSGGR